MTKWNFETVRVGPLAVRRIQPLKIRFLTADCIGAKKDMHN